MSVGIRTLQLERVEVPDSGGISTLAVSFNPTPQNDPIPRNILRVPSPDRACAEAVPETRVSIAFPVKRLEVQAYLLP
jgi:hypothetical protein